MPAFVIMPPSVLSEEYMDLEQARRLAKTIGLYNTYPIITAAGGLATGREWLEVLCNDITPALTENGKLHLVLVATRDEVNLTYNGETPEAACARRLVDNGEHLSTRADEVTIVQVFDAGDDFHIQWIRNVRMGTSQMWREFHGQI